jgi:hypothetical protein
MTKRLLSFIAAAAVLFVAAPLYVPASAAEMSCRIPFSFIVNGKTLPAGTYTIGNSNGVLLLNGRKDGVFVLSTGTSRAADRSGHGSVVFSKSGSRYDLIEIWSSDGDGREVRPSSLPKEERSRVGAAAAERIVIRAM